MKRKYTLGPWIVNDIGYAYPLAIKDANGTSIAKVRRVPKANANLIAAAPDMLKALEKIVDRLDGQQDIDDNGRPNQEMLIITWAYNAIAKAKGGEL